MTRYEGSAAVVNAVDLLRTVWNEMVRQFPDVPVERRVDLYSAIMPAFMDITMTSLTDEDIREMEEDWAYEGKRGRTGRSDQCAYTPLYERRYSSAADRGIPMSE